VLVFSVEMAEEGPFPVEKALQVAVTNYFNKKKNQEIPK